MADKKVYLAGPFFDTEQMAAQSMVEELCQIYDIPAFSPRHELILKPDASLNERRQVFLSNVSHIKEARFLLANIEGKDTGTTWEMGAAYMAGIKVVAYSPNRERKINVMLAEGCAGYCQGWHEVEEFLHRLKNKTLGEMPKWVGEIE